jgi:hypothetical protein
MQGNRYWDEKNIWVVDHELKFASWEAVFPKGKMLDPWELWPFLKGVLEFEGCT